MSNIHVTDNVNVNVKTLGRQNVKMFNVHITYNVNVKTSNVNVNVKTSKR